MFWIIFPYFISAVKLISQIPEIVTYTGEVYTGNLLKYFEGINMMFRIEEKSSENIEVLLDDKLNIKVSDFIEFISGDNLIPMKLTSTETDEGYFILALNQSNVLLFFVSKFTLEVEIYIDQDLNQTFNGVKIDQGILTQDSVIVLVNMEFEVNGYKFKRHDIFFADIGDLELQRADCMWDIRYLHNIMMSVTDGEFVAFGVRTENEQYGSILIYSFQNLSCPVMLQVVDRYYSIPSYISAYAIPDPIDLAVSHGQLIILNSYNILILYKYLDNQFIEHHYSNFTGFGNVKSFSLAVEGSLCAIAAEDNIIVYDLKIYSKILYVASAWNSRGKTSIIYSQIQTDFIYFSSTTNYADSYFEIVQINLDSIQYLVFENLAELIPFDKVNFKGPWILLDGSGQRILIRQDFDGIRIIDILIPSYNFEVVSEVSGFIKFMAYDMISTAEARMNLTVLDQLDQINFIDGYYPARILYYDFPVFFMNKSQTIMIDLFTMLTGWNLSFSFEYNFTNFYNYTVSNVDDIYHNFTQYIKNGCKDAGFFGDVLYYIDNDGIVYKNKDTLISFGNAEKFVPIYKLSADIAILFPGYLITYEEMFDRRHRIPLNITCNIFKGFDQNVVCASYIEVLLINRTNVYGCIKYESLGESGSILDVAMIVSDNTTDSYVYVLMTTGIYMFRSILSNITHVVNKTIQADKIFSSFGYIVILTSQNLTTYTYDLDQQLKNYQLSDTYETSLMNGDVLLLQKSSQIFVYQPLSPVLRSLFSVFDVGNCKISHVQASFYMFICGNDIKLYTYGCPPVCTKLCYITFNLINISVTNQGSYRVPIPLIVTNGFVDITLNMFFMLYTYGATVFFDYEAVQLNLSYAYNIDSSIDLRFFVNGYSIDTLLYVNSVPQIGDGLDAPVQLINRTNITFCKNYSEIIRDFSIVKFTDLVLLLNSDYIVILNGTDEGSQEINISLSDYFDGSCFTIDFIDRNETLAFFIISCLSKEIMANYYYDGKIFNYSQTESLLFLFGLNINSFQIVFHNISYLPFEPSWIRVLPGSGRKFIILCVSSSQSQAGSILNNEVFVYKFSWDNYGFSLDKQVEINFFSLKLENFHASFIDGTYRSNVKNPDEDEIVLYIADLSFGIRVIRVADYKPVIIQNLDFKYDPPLSLSVCGSHLFCFTVGTNFIQFSIEDDFLIHRIMYPASPTTEYAGINSAATCSDYYRPVYISFFLKSTQQGGNYKLRVMNVFSNFNSSLHKDIQINCLNCSTLRVKSIFKDENLICYLNNEFKSFEITNLSSNMFYFPKLSKSAYTKMIKNFDYNDTFSLTIYASNKNSGLQVYSKPFFLKRTGPSKSDDDDDKVDLTYLVLVMIAGIVFALTIVALCVYKRIMKKKLKVSHEKQVSKFNFKPLTMNISSRSVLTNFGSVINSESF